MNEQPKTREQLLTDGHRMREKWFDAVREARELQQEMTSSGKDQFGETDEEKAQVRAALDRADETLENLHQFLMQNKLSSYDIGGIELPEEQKH